MGAARPADRAVGPPGSRARAAADAAIQAGLGRAALVAPIDLDGAQSPMLSEPDAVAKILMSV